jgi:hypothetical protein
VTKLEDTASGEPLALRSSDLFGGTGSEAMERGADISPCGRYRYKLWRKWGGGSVVAFVGLNPSTADATLDDPTIRRCIGYAKAWGHGSLWMLNLFAYRATDPNEMRLAEDPVGPLNNKTLREARFADVTVAAWGTHGAHRGRDAQALAMLPRLHYLRLTKDGHPGHPLYLPANLRPVEWVTPNVADERKPPAAPT